MNNPYSGVDWTSALRVASATHMHVPDQKTLENGHRFGIRHFPVSNYYPSVPYDAKTRPGDFRLRQHWPARRSEGQTLPPPVNWNDIISWKDELEEPYRSEIPFGEDEPYFTDVPDDVIISANAEHHGFTNSHAHICSPGSSFASGNIDQLDHYGLVKHGFSWGFGGTWQEAFAGMLESLLYPDGGGITVNHPTWFSRFTDEQVFEMLDYDPRVLGIEIYNDYSALRDWSQNPDYQPPEESAPGFSLNLWDRILATGRQCWGFSVPDHSVRRGGNWNGRNVLLVPEFTEHECLRAYRRGSFYGCLKNSGLTVTQLEVNGASLSIATNAPATIRLVTEKGVIETVESDSAEWCIPEGTTFARLEVDDDSGERLFLQPITFRDVG
jgi:hypothetical protein